MSPRVAQLASLMLLANLAACAGPHVEKVHMREVTYYPSGFDPAKDPYWEDLRWDKTLLNAVQSAVHDPADPADTSTPGLHAVVKFTYQDGTAEYPEIVQSTGDPNKDDLLLHQLASVQLPQATGVDVDQPHEFVLDLDMPTPFESFEYSIFDALDSDKIYPKSAVIAGVTGTSVISFDYLDGKAKNIMRIKSSGYSDLDKASMNAVTKAVLPTAPPAYAGKVIHMEPMFCYSLNGARECPTGRAVIQIYGTRIRAGF